MVFKNYKSKDKKWKIKIFFYENTTSKKEFTAMFINCFGYIFWLFKSKQIYYNWPKTS